MVLGHMLEKIEQQQGSHTAREIFQQPEIWHDTYKMLLQRKKEIEAFMSGCQKRENLKIILTGAGSSAFVGECAQVYLDQHVEQTVVSIATTDLVSHPSAHFDKKTPTLMVSYARSGNSPESIGAVKLANQIIDDVYHLIITCNASGELAKMQLDAENTLVIVMPEKSNDKGFAMTSSFTSMLLSSLVLFDIKNIENYRMLTEDLIAMGIYVLNEKAAELKSLSEMAFDRIIYLGAGALKGLARESALKMLELTSGRISTLYDSPLGFRHGPKSFLNEKTMVVIYFSNDPYAKQYEIDVLKELKKDAIAMHIVSVCEEEDICGEISALSDTVMTFGQSKLGFIEDAFLCMPYAIVAQLLSFSKSMAMGISPDNPSPSGLVNRVVQGVTLYAFNQ